MTAALSLGWRQPPGYLALRWRPAERPTAARPRLPTAILSALIGPPGTPGLDSQTARVDAIASVALGVGMPVAVNQTTGQFRLADAAYKPYAFVAGLCDATTAAGFIAHAARNSLMLVDWTVATGAVNLSPGSVYYLKVGGGLTVTPPTSPNNLAFIGTALDTRTLLLTLQPPIQT